jgi:hypothetical protein
MDLALVAIGAIALIGITVVILAVTWILTTARLKPSCAPHHPVRLASGPGAVVPSTVGPRPLRPLLAAAWVITAHCCCRNAHEHR